MLVQNTMKVQNAVERYEILLQVRRWGGDSCPQPEIH